MNHQDFNERGMNQFLVKAGIIKNLDDKLKADKTFKLQDRIYFRGLDIAVENKKGSIRKGVNDDGTKWSTYMHHAYGYIRRSKSISDGERIDCYVNEDNKNAENVYVVNQNNPFTGEFDEQKCMLGFNSAKEAKEAYLKQYDSPKFFGSMLEMPFDEFKRKVFSTEKKPKLIKSFLDVLKSFGSQISMFGGSDAMEGETRVKDGKTYIVKRSKKNPNVKRVFRADKEQPSLFGEGKPKPVKREQSGGVKVFGKKLIDGHTPKKASRQRKDTSKSELDLFSGIQEQAVPNKASKPKRGSGNSPIKEFGVAHLDSRIRVKRQEINKKVKSLLSSKTNEEMTDEDKKLLATYSGRGGTDEISLNEFYTPDYVAKFQWEMLEKLGYKGGTVLEAASGTGIFLHTAPDNALVTAVEYDETSSRIADILFGKKHEVFNQSFEKFNMSDADKDFAASIGNVPFGKRGRTIAEDPEKVSLKTHEQYFLDRIIDNLDEGGLASIIVPTGIMDNQISDYRLELNKKGEFLGAIRMPTGVFKKANAQVTTDIVFFRKRPQEVIDRLAKLERTELSDLYDAMVLDAEFVNGTFFDKNPEYALGEEKMGQFGTKIRTGDISENDLRRVGELLKDFEQDYKVLNELGIETKRPAELHVGDTIVRNGRTYMLNENHRWEKVDKEEAEQELLPKDVQELLGVSTSAELEEVRSDTARYNEFNREQIKVINSKVGEELDYYASSNHDRNEMLKEGVVLGLAIKEFQKEMQTSSDIDASAAQKKAQKLAMMLEEFRERYGHPLHEARLGSQMGKSPENPFLYLVSSFDDRGKLSKLFLDPKSFYNVYYPSYATKESSYNPKDIESIIAYQKNKGLSRSVEAIKSLSAEGDGLTADEFKRKLLLEDGIFIDENSEYDTLNEVCSGEVYAKIDAWQEKIDRNKKRLQGDGVSDEIKEYLVAENKKLDEQIFEIKRRAEIKTIDDLPIDMSDANRFFDIKYLNDYLRAKLGSEYKGEIIFSEKRNMFTFKNDQLNHIYTLYMAKAVLDKGEKRDLANGINAYFSGQKQQISLVLLNLINGLSYGNVSDSTRDKLKDLEDNFRTFLSESVDDVGALEDKYNRAFNNFIQKQYDNSVIEGLSKIAYDKVLYTDENGKDVTIKEAIQPFKWATVRRFYDQGKGLIAHGVGLGKTLSSILLGALEKETGRSKKPTYIVPKSTLGNWVSEIKQWCTDDVRLLVVGAHQKLNKDGSPALDKNGKEIWVEDSANEKKVKLSRVINENFDYILMTRDFYTDIDMSPQTKENMINELVDKFYVSRGDENDKQIEKKKAQIEAKLAQEFMKGVEKDKFGQYRKTDEIYFENLGIDMIVGDESHAYKNLIESVLHSDIKYLNVKHSQRAMDFYFKSKIIRSENDDRGVYSLSATPISNSPMEIFNMSLPYAEKEFENMGINNIDDFIQKFAEIDSVPTMTAGAKISKKKIFTKFKNLNLLRKTFFKYADYKTSKMVDAEVHFPKENAEFVQCEQSEAQKEIMRGLKLRLGLHEYKDALNNHETAKSLIDDGFLTEEELSDLKEYKKLHDVKVANIAGMLNKPTYEVQDFYFNILDDMKKATADLEWYEEAKSVWADVNPADIDMCTLPKVQQLLDRAITSYKDNGKQLIFADNTNLHGKVKDKLIEMGIPESEILIVNGKTMKTSQKRLKASQDYNSGKYKVVIGNYATMGEGLNFNKGTTNIHHLQPSWNSKDIDQGNGRGIRQGNVLDEVKTHYYLTKGTIDAFFNQKILDKRGFVDAILNSKANEMVNDEGNISADEMQIALAENPEVARRLLEKKNAAMQKALKEREIKQNYSKLDKVYTLQNRLMKMQDKGSLSYKTLDKEIHRLKDQLNSSDVFKHKDALSLDKRPIIIPEHEAIVNVGSVVDYGYGYRSEKAIVQNYSHSTGRITLRTFNTYETRTHTIPYAQFANSYDRIIKPTQETSSDIFSKMINEDNLYLAEVVEQLPKDIFLRHKERIINNIKDYKSSDYIIAKKPNGDYIGEYADDAIDRGYKIIFPQDVPDFYNVVDKAYKTLDDEGRNGYNSAYKVEKVAKRVYGKNWKNKIKALQKKARAESLDEHEEIILDEVA